MNDFERIENDINKIKELDESAGNLLHDQLHYATQSARNREDMTKMVMGDYADFNNYNNAANLLDKDLMAFDETYETILSIQNDIINCFSI